MLPYHFVFLKPHLCYCYTVLTCIQWVKTLDNLSQAPLSASISIIEQLQWWLMNVVLNGVPSLTGAKWYVPVSGLLQLTCSESQYLQTFSQLFFLPMVKVGEIFMNWVCIMHKIKMKSLESCSQCRPRSSCGIDLFLNRGECGWEWVTMIWCSEYVVIMVDFNKVQWKITNITCIFRDSQTKTFYYSTFTSSFTAWRFSLIKEAEVLPYFHCIVLMLSYLTITFTTQFT